jgi:membrane protease YdiL (CAAX protease family)
VFLHRDKPALELAEALWAGIVFAVVAWRSGSFLPAFVAHWAVAVTMDWRCFRALHAGG